MYKKIDNSGQGSAELLLIVGGLLVIVLCVGNYISNISSTAQENFKELLKQERDFLINKI